MSQAMDDMEDGVTTSASKHEEEIEKGSESVESPRKEDSVRDVRNAVGHSAAPSRFLKWRRSSFPTSRLAHVSRRSPNLQNTDLPPHPVFGDT